MGTYDKMEIFEEIPTFEEVGEKNFQKNKQQIEDITKKIVDVIMKENKEEITSNTELKVKEMNFINSIKWNIIIENFAKKWWKIEIKNNVDKQESRIWNSLKITNIT